MARPRERLTGGQIGLTAEEVFKFFQIDLITVSPITYTWLALTISVEVRMAIAEQVLQALSRDLVVDITTTGRKSGQPRTLEIWFHRIDGRYYITGWPGVRGWYANLLEEPRFTIHFTHSANVATDAIARPVTDEAERRNVIQAVFDMEGGASRGDFESWVATSPVVEFTPVS